MAVALRIFYLLAPLVSACSSGPETMIVETPPVIVNLEHADILTSGSLLLVTASGLRRTDVPVLELTDGAQHASLSIVDGAAKNELLYELDDAAFAVLGEGAHQFSARLVVGDRQSEPFATDAQLQQTIPLTFATLQVNATVHHNDVVVVRGDGFLAPTEGRVQAHFVGEFEDDRSMTTQVDVRFDVHAFERFSRDRGLFTLGTDLGGIRPGTFTGSVALVDDQSNATATMPVTLNFAGPEIFSIDPSSASLGQYVSLRGAGFVGCADGCDEVTTLTLDGTFTPKDGTAASFGPVELVPEFISGEQVRFVVETRVNQYEELVSSLFDARQGVWQGHAQVTTTRGQESVQSERIPGQFTLSHVRQIVHLTFLPGFYEALLLFGLAEAAPEIEQGIVDRISSIYRDYAIEVTLDTPPDFAPRVGFAVVEIGGTDPNGSGLFGFDNSPGKDVGNLRLFDTIGGANAATQADGYAGYGGVFIESFLAFSMHPDLPGVSTTSADPLFDEVFDGVRASAATRSEIMGQGEAARVAQVARAVRSLSNLIGETTSHELGHSLGLASPYSEASANVFHDPGDEEGCLMESGGARPLGERFAEPGFAESIFCYDIEYLESILGTQP